MAALINQVEWCRHAAQTVGVGTAQEQYSIDWHINSAPKNGQTPVGERAGMDGVKLAGLEKKFYRVHPANRSSLIPSGWLAAAV